MNIKSLCAALLLLPIMVAAGVNPKNGSFFITYEEITQKSGNHELSLPRTYNSKSVALGWFGYGWGTPYETGMVVMPDGTVAVKENGSGEITFYGSSSSDKVQASVDKIVAVASEREKLERNDAIALRGKLLADEYLRLTKVTRHGIQSELPTGAIARSRGCLGSAVSRIDDEYRRTNCNRSNDYFDLAGHLIRHETDGYKFTVHYSDKYPDRIEDSLGQKLFFKWTDDGHIAEARTGEPKPLVQFIYNKKHDLVLSNIIEGNFYKFEYDDNHNMSKIGYIDNTHMDMQYDGIGSITSLTERDGTKATYTYRIDPANPLHYWTTTTVTSVSGRQESREQEFLTTDDAAEKRASEAQDRERQRQHEERISKLQSCKREAISLQKSIDNLESVQAALEGVATDLTFRITSIRLQQSIIDGTPAQYRLFFAQQQLNNDINAAEIMRREYMAAAEKNKSNRQQHNSKSGRFFNDCKDLSANVYEIGDVCQDSTDLFCKNYNLNQ